MTHFEHIENAHRGSITEDVKTLVEKYVSIFEGDVPDIDENVANALILVEMRKALKDIQDDQLKKILN